MVVSQSPDEESAAFERLATAADVCWLIAPETHGLLAERCRRVEAAATVGRIANSSHEKLAGPSSAAVQLCGDKLELAGFLASRGISTIPTHPLPAFRLPPSAFARIVVKPRFGAGSEGVRVLRVGVGCPEFNFPPESSDRPTAFNGKLNSGHPTPSSFVWQRYHPGLAVSVAAIIGPECGGIEVFPLCRQLLTDDGTFAYLGGEFPVHTDRNDEIDQLVRRTCRAIDGLRGYVGFDLILPESAAEPVVLVEINPRLTTSYVGYRRLTTANIAARAIGADERHRGRVWKIQNCDETSITHERPRPRNFEFSTPDPNFTPIDWQQTPLRFFPDGRCIGERDGL